MIKKIISSLIAAVCIGTMTVNAADISSLDSTCHGYGQGREVDECNRPVGAIQFNDEYGCYDCRAMLDSDKKICLTFEVIL